MTFIIKMRDGDDFHCLGGCVRPTRIGFAEYYGRAVPVALHNVQILSGLRELQLQGIHNREGNGECSQVRVCSLKRGIHSFNL